MFACKDIFSQPSISQSVRTARGGKAAKACLARLTAYIISYIHSFVKYFTCFRRRNNSCFCNSDYDNLQRKTLIKQAVGLLLGVLANGMRYDIYSPAKNIQMHILLPKERSCSKLLINSENTEFDVSTVRNSKYVDFTVSDINDKKVSVEIIF